jgi:hypothetical protein
MNGTASKIYEGWTQNGTTKEVPLNLFGLSLEKISDIPEAADDVREYEKKLKLAVPRGESSADGSSSIRNSIVDDDQEYRSKGGAVGAFAPPVAPLAASVKVPEAITALRLSHNKFTTLDGLDVALKEGICSYDAHLSFRVSHARACLFLSKSCQLCRSPLDRSFVQ